MLQLFALFWLGINGVGGASSPFISTWTVTAGQVITLPLTLPANFSVDWGDGSAAQNISFTNTSITHTYVNASSYNVSILGDVAGFRFNGAGSFLAITKIVSWGDSFIMNGTSSNAFFNCSNLTSIPASGQPVILPETSLAGMFSSSGLNSPLHWNLANVTSILGMFQAARYFNGALNFTNTDNLQDTSWLFFFAPSFNQPITFQTGRVRDMNRMFRSARAFNQPINFNTTSLLTTARMFHFAQGFNSPVTFSDSSKVTDMTSMFDNAQRFNQPITFRTDSVLDMNLMFQGTPFNQPVNFNTSSVVTMEGMFREAVEFNQPIDFDTRSVTNFNGMFAGAIKFNQTVRFSSTTNASYMDDMFSNVRGFKQSLAAWDTQNVQNCSDFCYACGLPSFSLCAPCGSPQRCVNKVVCNCPYTDTCELIKVDPNLQIGCNSSKPLPVAPTPAGVLILSPLVNITLKNDSLGNETLGNETDSNSSGFVFTLPIDPRVYQEIGKVVSRPCAAATSQINCEWQDPNTLEFRRSGCESQNNVDMGSGVVGTQCTCTHLTVFALVLRSDLQLTAMCQAETADYVLIALYAALAVVLLVQLTRLVRFRLARISILQHSMLLLVCVLRIAYLIAKPVIDSLAGLLSLGLLPSAVSLTLFIYLLLAWASLQQATFSTNPFSRCKIPFVLMTLLVVLAMAAIVILSGLLPQSKQLDVAKDGSYVLAALYAVVCVLVLLSGLGLRRTLASSVGSSSSSDGGWRKVFRNRVLIVTLGLSISLFLAACLWVAAVQTDIIVSSAATLATSVSFFVVDWLSVCILVWLLSKAIDDGVTKARRSQHGGEQMSRLSSKSSEPRSS